ncbi:DUF4012 domain-containing protein [Bifidobacterium oedipodis]|uniref:Chemotaxis protein n=1 Tax=Bifidobacterium oedipodis TaxID=2675322 RepID=A0A7Y0EQA3_9BIFI|nr:DUF4012 domain-containing protein [Bifidobacterium sp. DSM 109957]NMM93341.1 hypothetical protein [Bifidobacterium sp. DSM 109957]
MRSSGRHGTHSAGEGPRKRQPEESHNPKIRLINPQHVGRRGRSLVGRTPVWARVLVVAFLMLLACVTCVTTLYAASVSRMYTNAQRVLSSAEAMANTALGCGSDQSLSDAAQELVDSTNALNKELNGPQWDVVRDNSKYGSDITAAREMLASVDTLVNGPFTDLMNLANRLQGFSLKDDSVDVSALMEMPDIISKTHTDLQEQIAKLEAIEEPSIAKVAAVLNAEKMALTTIDSMLSEYDAMINLLPQLLGKEGKRTYLVLVQNPAELRSSGGMIGTVAAITADNGTVTIGDFESTGFWDRPEEPMDDLVLDERDVFGATFDVYPATTTIDPEFSRVAQLNIYDWKVAHPDRQDEDFAGVISLDPVFLQSLLSATGSVTLSDGKVLDGTTTTAYLLHDLYIDHPDLEDQNKFVSEAAKEIMNHVLGNANASTISALLKSVRDMSASGHLKLWMEQSAEQEALINTGLIDDQAAGELSADETAPEAGIYLSELQMGKQDYYLTTETTVKKTCGETTALDQAVATGILDDRIDSAALDTRLSQFAEEQLGDEYTVTFTMKNTMTEHEAKTLPDFITSSETSENPGGMLYRVVLAAPFNGEITSVQADIDQWGTNTASLYDRQYVVFDADWILPGEEATIAYTVRVSAKASQALNVLTTPVVNKDGIETGSNGKVIDECSADTTADDSSDAAADAGQSGDQGNQSDQSDAAAGSEDVSAIDKLRGQLSCPVDIKSIAAAV